MKHLYLTLFTFIICSSYLASDCFVNSFRSNYLINSGKNDVYFVKGIKLDTLYHGMKLKVLEDFKQNLQKDTIMVWCSDGNSFRIGYSNSFNDNDTLFMLITKTDLEANKPGDFNDIPDDLEKPEDYMPIHCAISFLRYSNGFVTGYISSISNQTSLLYTDFVNLLSNINQYDINNKNLIYPNPAKTELNVILDNDIILPVVLEIYTIDGKFVQYLNVSAYEFSFDIRTLNKGTYMILRKDNCNECLIGKFIKL